MAEITLKAKDESLDAMNMFLEEQFDEMGLGMKLVMKLMVVMEELFVNVAHYAYPDGKGDCKIEMNLDGDVLTIRITDSGIPFDPVAKSDPDVKAKAEDRSIGGLGIYIVKQTMTTMEYERKEDKNILTMTKNIKEV